MQADTSPPAFQRPEPTPEAVATLPGATVLEFGTDWCGHCHRAQPLIAAARAEGAAAVAAGAGTAVRHWRIEDGPGRPLGRAYGVRLWPTLVFLRDGQEVARLVRPTDAGAVREVWRALAQGQ